MCSFVGQREEPSAAKNRYDLGRFAPQAVNDSIGADDQLAVLLALKLRHYSAAQRKCRNLVDSSYDLLKHQLSVIGRIAADEVANRFEVSDGFR